MNYQMISNPVKVIIIDDFFTDDINKKIIDEAFNNEGDFTNAGVTNKDKKYSGIRTNTISYYDELYKNNRNKSILLTELDNKFKNQEFSEVLSSSPYPINRFNTTNSHETQVSRYGNNKQKYDWHVDSSGGVNRLITIVYYFNTTPKKYTGGNVMFSDSPLYNGKLIIDNPNTAEIEPINNRAVIFGSSIPHCVNETHSLNNFKDGRFSVNIWLGTV
jgi:Rps23 Pro-64 3,4-dihydroxylase Tpa1-like proline 4-hydroxylase